MFASLCHRSSSIIRSYYNNNNIRFLVCLVILLKLPSSSAYIIPALDISYRLFMIVHSGLTEFTHAFHNTTRFIKKVLTHPLTACLIDVHLKPLHLNNKNYAQRFHLWCKLTLRPDILKLPGDKWQNRTATNRTYIYNYHVNLSHKNESKYS